MGKKSTNELTIDYIKKHPHIKHCLKKGIINYSSLARLLAEELALTKKTSKEAILVAARRYREVLKKEKEHEKKIAKLLEDSSLEIKNKLAVFVISKHLPFTKMEKLQSTIKQQHRIFHILEGAATHTIIVENADVSVVRTSCRTYIHMEKQHLSSILLKSSEIIETTPGVIAYLASLFAENGVNVVECISTWTDTLFIIHTKDVPKVLTFLPC